MLSIIAVAVSAAGLYIQSMYGTATLSLQITGFGLQQHGKNIACTVDVALFNSGNRDTALLRVGLRQGRTLDSKDGVAHTTFTEYSPDTTPPGYVNVVVKGGDIRLLTLVFPTCQASAISSAIAQGGLNHFTLATDAVDYNGKRSTVSTSFAKASVAADGSLTFVMHLAGQFDLLKDGAHYAGDAKGQSETLSFDKDGHIRSSHTVSS